MLKNKFVHFFKELGIKDVAQVGGKNASLGEMYSHLTAKGLRIPNGFATTASAYNYFLESTGLKKKIQKILAGLDTKDVRDLMKRGAAIRKLIIATEMPQDFQTAILKAYRELSLHYKTKNVDVAVRSSATAEDLPDASFAGQQETYLNITGEKDLLLAVRKCIASLFTDRAISYRVDKKFDHFSIALSVGIQKMVRSDLGSSGVMFTIDTESGFRNAVLINSIFGLGENIVQGHVNPDEYYVFKPTTAIISKTLAKKNIKMIYNFKGQATVKNVPIAPADQLKPSLSDQQVIQLAKWAMIIEDHYQHPMDMEFALDGRTNELYITQARPETVQSLKDWKIIEKYKLTKAGQVITSGQSVGNRIGAGRVNRMMSLQDINKFKPGQVLVTDMTDPDWEPIMKIAAAIVTDKGGRTCHAAIVSRELGIPCVVGTENGSVKIKSGQAVTVDCAQGEEGFVYEGVLPFTVAKTNIKDLKKPRTKIMMNIAEPDLAFTDSFIPNDGVGLARLEFIINNYIKIHPLALLNYNKLKDQAVKRQIAALTAGYSNKEQYYINRLAQGVAMIAAAYYPKDVIVRFSDFKTNEYANLIGGKEYEPIESNPMIGFRGASRYYSPLFQPAFALECRAIKQVREAMGLKNVKVMIPFCRTVEEGKMVQEVMAKNGLKRGQNGLEIYVMAEIPANIILAEKFCQIFDGFSIGSNDLTQLTLGIDRDSGGTLAVAGVANEKNEAVKDLIRQLIKVAKKYRRKVGICGQGPSDFPDFAEFLVGEGIDSISLSPDTVISTTLAILKKEKDLRRHHGLLGMFF
jgi:pyruvate,water dikinase